MKEWICCIILLGYTGYSRHLNFKHNWTNLPKLWLAMGWKLESPDEWLNLHFRPWTVKLPPHILGHSPLHSLDQVLDEKAVDVSQGMVVLVITLSSWEGWWRTNTACQAGWLGVALLLVVLGSWRRHHWGHEGSLGAGWSVRVGACDADGDSKGCRGGDWCHWDGSGRAGWVGDVLGARMSWLS